MKIIFLFFLFISCFNCYSQSKGFEFLAASKSSLESVIRSYAKAIPDSSDTYKQYYLSLITNYNKAKASYDGYRGAMKDCILNNETKGKIQRCLQSKSVSIKSQLDSLDNVLERAYLDAYLKKTIKKNDPVYSGQNTGLFTGDFIKSLLDTLLNGTLKLWDQTKKYRKEYKDNYLNNIASKDYDLSDVDDLLTKKVLPNSPK
jgi:hypothetical protein